MCVYKNHAFIYFLRPPLWSGTLSSLLEKMSPTVRGPPKQIFFWYKILLKENGERKRRNRHLFSWNFAEMKWQERLISPKFCQDYLTKRNAAVLGMHHGHSKSKLQVHFQAARPCQYCRFISVLHVHVPAAWPCPCGISQYMLHVHVLAACQCPCCMSMLMLYVEVHAAFPCQFCMFESMLLVQVRIAWMWTCIYIDMQHGHGHAAWHGHAARAWTYSMYWDMLHGHTI
jgi:hypothetical protein